MFAFWKHVPVCFQHFQLSCVARGAPNFTHEKNVYLEMFWVMPNSFLMSSISCFKNQLSTFFPADFVDWTCFQCTSTTESMHFLSLISTSFFYFIVLPLRGPPVTPDQLQENFHLRMIVDLRKFVNLKRIVFHILSWRWVVDFSVYILDTSDKFEVPM